MTTATVSTELQTNLLMIYEHFPRENTHITLDRCFLQFYVFTRLCTMMENEHENWKRARRVSLALQVYRFTWLENSELSTGSLLSNILWTLLLCLIAKCSFGSQKPSLELNRFKRKLPKLLIFLEYSAYTYFTCNTRLIRINWTNSSEILEALQATLLANISENEATRINSSNLDECNAF